MRLLRIVVAVVLLLGLLTAVCSAGPNGDIIETKSMTPTTRR